MNICLFSQVKYKKEYEKTKAQSDYNVLPATDNPLLRQLRYAGTILSDVCQSWFMWSALAENKYAKFIE